MTLYLILQLIYILRQSNYAGRPRSLPMVLRYMSFPLSPIPSCLSHYHKAYNYITIFHCSRHHHVHVLKNVIQLLLLAGHEIINIDNNLNNLRWHLDSVICTFDKIKVQLWWVGPVLYLLGGGLPHMSSAC